MVGYRLNLIDTRYVHFLSLSHTVTVFVAFWSKVAGQRLSRERISIRLAAPRSNPRFLRPIPLNRRDLDSLFHDTIRNWHLIAFFFFFFFSLIFSRKILERFCITLYILNNKEWIRWANIFEYTLRIRKYGFGWIINCKYFFWNGSRNLRWNRGSCSTWYRVTTCVRVEIFRIEIVASRDWIRDMRRNIVR